MNRKKIVLSVGPDLNSNGGGIASVIKSYYAAYSDGSYDFDFILFRTIGHIGSRILANGLYFIYAYLKLLILLISNRDIQILHIHSSSHYSFLRKSIIAITARLFNKRTIIHLHSSKFCEFFLSKNRFVSMWINFVFKRVDIVVTLCKKWQLELNNKYPEAHITTIHNPIVIPRDAKYLDHSTNKGIFTVLFIAFLSTNKGLMDVVSVAKIFKKTNININFKIAGRGQLESHLIEVLNLQECSNIEFVGWADEKAKKTLYEQANIFFLPSYNEGMPIVILEAMAYSLPVVSTTISGIPDQIDNAVNGFLYNPGDINGFVEGITKLYYDKDIYRKATQAAWEKVQRFSNDKIFEEITALYSKRIIIN